MSSTTQQPARTIAHAFVDFMNSHDAEAIDDFISDDYIDHNFYVENGRVAQKALWQTWFTAFPDTEVTMVGDALADGNRVAGRFSYQATFLGSFMGLQPTGRVVQMQSIDVWRVADGIAVEHWDVISGRAFFAQLAGETGES
ncbi:ester cyclase [Mycobacteroides abscessus]|uniref:ester cyclase n=1 Tax=Mycobacteroides abscessus TaxID=36809 RepID=UPI000C262B1B|nr:ester cyclase [Mycobacteroides abscessus]